MLKSSNKNSAMSREENAFLSVVPPFSFLSVALKPRINPEKRSTAKITEYCFPPMVMSVPSISTSAVSLSIKLLGRGLKLVCLESIRERCFSLEPNSDFIKSSMNSYHFVFPNWGRSASWTSGRE